MTPRDLICRRTTNIATMAAGFALSILGCSSDPAPPVQATSSTGGAGTTGVTSAGNGVTGAATSGSSVVTGATTTGASGVGGAATSGSSVVTGATTTGASGVGGATSTVSTTSNLTSATSGGAGGTGTVPVSCATPLEGRVTVSNIPVSPEVDLDNGQSWGATGLPVILATSANGTAKVAWTDGSDVHITPLNASDQRAGDDATVTGSEVRGLVAHDDGSAVLVRQGDEMVFIRLDAAGNTQASLSIVGGNSHTSDGDRWIDDWPHQGRLAWSGSEYAAYFGQTGNHGSQGDHQGDQYAFISPDGMKNSGGWNWGCSHSLDERLAHNGTTFAPICTSDTYPGAGIWFENDVEVSSEPSITNVGGGTKLGGLVPAPDGFWLTFASPEQRSSYDVAFLHIANDGSPSGKVYLTDTANVDERYSHLAAYGDGLLAGWGEETDLTLAVLDAAGSIVEGPVAASAEAGGLDDFASYPNGDVGWAFAGGDLSNLQVHRVTRCE